MRTGTIACATSEVCPTAHRRKQRVAPWLHPTSQQKALRPGTGGATLKRPLAAIILTVASGVAVSPLASAVNAPSQEESPPYFLETETHRFTTLPGGKQNDVFDSITRVYQDDSGKRRVEWFWNASQASGTTPSLYRIFIDIPNDRRYSLDPVAGTVRESGYGSDVMSAEDAKDLHVEDSDDPPRGVEPVSTGEELGEDVIFGISVTGFRTVDFYPASEDGTRPAYKEIEEHWYSDELRQPMRIEVSDPKRGRFVTTTTQFARGAQDPALFEVPAGYKVARTAPAPE